jgi:hypothetical protein
MNSAVGPAVGCLMATFGTSLITDCIFDFDDPVQLQDVGLEQRLELWGLQVWQRKDSHLRDLRRVCSDKRVLCTGRTMLTYLSRKLVQSDKCGWRWWQQKHAAWCAVQREEC